MKTPNRKGIERENMIKEFLLKITTPKQLSEEEKHQKFINKAYANRNRSQMYCKVIIGLFIVTYGFMFTSKLLIPTASKIEYPVPWTEYQLGVHQATLVRYEYSPSQGIAEIEFDLSETSYEEGSYSYAVTENGTPLESKVVYESESSLVINIQGIQTESSDIYFSLGWMRSESDFDQIKLTYPVKGLSHVKDLTPKTPEAYQIQRLDITIKNDNQTINELTKDNEEKQQYIQDIAVKNQELTESMEYKTEEQKAEIEVQITNNQTAKEETIKQIASNNTTIAQLEEEITKTKALQSKIKTDQ